MSAVRVARLGAFAAALLGAEPDLARAEPSENGADRRVHLGLRTGFGLPFGKYADVRTFATFRDSDVNALSDDIHGAIPLWLDAGYRVTPRLMLGGYLVYGLVLPKVAAASDPLGGGCPEQFECAALGVRAGLQAQYRFGDGPVRPWVGVALGYEWVQSSITGEVLDLEVSTWHHGPELLHVQGGADFRLSEGFGLGPFAALSALRYASCSLVVSGQEQACELDAGAWHGWAVLGVRGALEL